MSPAHKRSVITWAAGLGFALLFSFYILGWYLLGLLAVVSAWVYYSSLEGVGPRPGLRDLLDRTVAFLLGTRWAEVLHNRLNGGGGHWKGRGRSVRGRPQAGPRNPGRAPGNSCKWELVNCEQRNPLAEAYAGERSPADLMMGSYLSNENSAQASFGNREIRNRYSRPNPMQTPTRRLSFGEHQAMMNKFTVTPRRRYPIHQPQYSVPGTLPTVRWDGYQKKNVLSSRNSPMVQSPVTVKIARPDANMMRSSLLDYMMSPAVSPLTDPCSKATVLSALKESRKRAVEDDAERTLISERENKRRRHDSSGSGHSAFEPLLANGAPASLIPKPGTLKRSTNSQCSDDPISKRSRTSSISSLSSTCVGGKHSSPRNPIFSSYSSTRGHVQGAKNYVCVRNASPLSSPASSRSQTPERPGKKKREEVVQRSDTSTPVKVDRTEKDQTVEEESVCLLSKSSPSTVDCSPSEGDGKRKRKIPLLSKRKGDQLTLHPPLELGYTITADDVDSEKKAGLDRIKKALQEKEEPAKSPTPVTTTTVPSLSVTFTAPTGEISAEPTASSTPISAVVSSPLLVSLKKMQNCSNAVSNSDSVDGVTSSNTVKALESSAIAFKNDVLPPPTTLTTSMAMTTDIAGFKPIDVLNFSCSSITQPLITPINKPATKAITTTTNSCQVSALVSPQENKVSKEPEMSTVACTGSSAPPSTSFSLPSTVTAKPAVTSVTAPSSASTAGFKPVFGLPVAQQTNIVSTASSLTMPVTTPVTLASITSSCATSTISFKPVFGNSSTPATSTTTSTPFTFGQSTQAAINNETAVTTTCPKSISSLFPFTASNSLAGSNVDSETKGSKATFSFGLSVAVTSKPNTTTTAINNVSSPQLFQFGSNPSTTTAAPSDVFQFGKGSADTSATSASPRASVFGQSTVVTSQVSTSIAPTSNLFGGFGPSVSTPATTSSGQLALAFGNSAKTSLFGNATSAPPFGGPTAQLNFGGTGSQSTFGTNAAATQKVPSKTPAFGNAVTPFSFGASAVKSAFPSTTSQSTFGTPSQSVFGSATAQTGFGSVSTQPFGSTSAAFSFGTTTTSTAAPMFNATKSLSGGTTGSIFGSSQMVGFGSSNQAAVTTSGFTLAASNPNIAAAGFFGSGQSGFCSSNPSVPFATSTSTASSQNMFGSALTNQAQQNQSTPQFNFGATNTVENKPVFGGFNFGTTTLNFGAGTAASGFGQSTPSGNFSFGPTGAPATTFGSPGAGAAAPSAFAGTPTFSIGAGSRPTGTRQRLQARRQHVRKR